MRLFTASSWLMSENFILIFKILSLLILKFMTFTFLYFVYLILLMIKLVTIACCSNTGNRKRINALFNPQLILQFNLSLPLFLSLLLQFFYIGVQNLVLIDHISELKFQLLILCSKLLVLLNAHSAISVHWPAAQAIQIQYSRVLKLHQ